jgi:hypothetical protein
VLLLALDLAVWECFLVAARPFGHAWPVAAVSAAVGNLAVGLAGGSVLQRQLGSALPGLVWIGVALTFASGSFGEDRVVPGNGRGLAFLFAGGIAAAVAAGLADARHKGATPEAGSRR